MRCPNCSSLDTQVKDSRPTEDSSVIRRRRVCLTCNFRFTTFERVQLRDLVVIKSDSSREPFERDKLVRSLKLALQKRPVEADTVERTVNDIVRHLETLGDADIPAKTIGAFAMNALAGLDSVAYVRYASVYKNFHEVNDFSTFLGDLASMDKKAKNG